ncbi:FAA hydrolase family protein [Roseomonas sp. KE2513]|uniref:fumarylacetoacetate hydrolase family protein n=1 Tax=Roseomonas sp. KE2513 TaxID=2479202 RepID=UPI0018DF9363|nr:fumarylacetoacetate hydrolase family protein [Roseomonas sp. KE2513]MBI0538792.1 FAA hydrolase family protein [Roseomonas sp. KE2513]
MTTALDLLFEPDATPTLEVEGGGRVPVSRIFCVGRNYEAHAAEMGTQVDREAPFWFTKSLHAIVESGSSVAYPPGTGDYHHEIELVVVLGHGGFQVPLDKAQELIFGYAAGLDMTRRDLQLASRAKGRPWDTGKDFEESAVIGKVAPAARIGHPARGRICLSVNGVVKQDADLDHLAWKVPELIANLSTLYRLRPGDLIMTGTPAGVGPVVVGDRLEGEVNGVGAVSLSVSAAAEA